MPSAWATSSDRQVVESARERSARSGTVRNAKTRPGLASTTSQTRDQRARCDLLRPKPRVDLGGFRTRWQLRRATTLMTALAGRGDVGDDEGLGKGLPAVAPTSGPLQAAAGWRLVRDGRD
jgi:hypothetical protein